MINKVTYPRFRFPVRFAVSSTRQACAAARARQCLCTRTTHMSAAQLISSGMGSQRSGNARRTACSSASATATLLLGIVDLLAGDYESTLVTCIFIAILSAGCKSHTP